MAFSHGKSAVLKIADAIPTLRDFTGVLNSIERARSAETAETTVLGNTSKSYLGGLKEGNYSIGGPRDAVFEGYLDGILGLVTTYEYYPEGTASTKVKYSGSAILTSFSESSNLSDANSWQGELTITGDETRAIVP